ncbi:hypothetical protein LBMAG18_09480 [Alphaproteobacteria bacterium]|nr:hypothetical protein LBMAG18_09480 [Alphaproteobacteria bacterium]
MLNKYLNNYLLVFAAPTGSQGSDTSSTDNLKLKDFEISDLQELIDKINKINEIKEDKEDKNNNNDNLISNIIAELNLQEDEKQKYKDFLKPFLDQSDKNFESVNQKFLIVKTKKDPKELNFSFKKNSLLVLFKAMKKLKEDDNNKYNEFPVKDLATAVNGLYLKKFNEDKDYRNNFSNEINSPSDNDEIADDVVKNISNIFSAYEAIDKNYYNDKLEQDTKDKLLKGEELKGDVYNKIRRTNKKVLAGFVFSLITFIPFLVIGMAGGVGGLSMGLALGFSLIPLSAALITGAALFYKYSSKQGINAKNILKKVAKFKEIIDKQDKVAKSKEIIDEQNKVAKSKEIIDKQEQNSQELGGSLSASLTFEPQKTRRSFDPDNLTLEDIIDNKDIELNITSKKQSLIYNSLKDSCDMFDKTEHRFDKFTFIRKLRLNLLQDISKLSDKSKKQTINENIREEFEKELRKESIDPQDIDISTDAEDIDLVFKDLNSGTYLTRLISDIEKILSNAGITFDDDGTLIVDKPTKKINPASDEAGTETKEEGTTNELHDGEVSEASNGDTGVGDLADLQDHEPVEQNSSQESTSGGGNDGGTRDGVEEDLGTVKTKVGDVKISSNGEGGEVNLVPNSNIDEGGRPQTAEPKTSTTKPSSRIKNKKQLQNEVERLQRKISEIENSNGGDGSGGIQP